MSLVQRLERRRKRLNWPCSHGSSSLSGISWQWQCATRVLIVPFTSYGGRAVGGLEHGKPHVGHPQG